MKDAMQNAEKIRDWTEHMMDTDKLLSMLNTSLDKGMTEEAIAEKARIFGQNRLTEKKGKPWYCVFLEEQTGFFSLLLWLGSFLCFIGFFIQEDREDKSNLYLGVVLAFVVFVTGCFSYAQTSKAASLMADFKNFIPPKALINRGGAFKEYDAVDIVPGDIIEVKGGDNIPADIVLLKASEMKVNNASLTGEAEEILRDLSAKHDNILETGNAAFFGTQCTNGKGIGVVIKTGDNTVIGLIANLTISAESAETPLSIEIERFIKIISAVAITLGVTFFIVGLLYGYNIITNLVFAIGIIVANVPEGLLATVTVSLALTAKSMAKKYVLVKNLESVETLGSTSCICSDKTGTLTQNRMTVSQMFYNKNVLDAGVNYQIFVNQLAREEAKGDQKNLKAVAYPMYDPKTDSGFEALIKSVALSTTSTFGFEPKNGDIIRHLAKSKGKNVKSFPEQIDAESEHWGDFSESRQALIDLENEKPYMKKQVMGDASETGLVRFIQPLLMKEYAYDCNGLDGIRNTYPMFTSVENVEEDGKIIQKQKEIVIPFNSGIKFNMITRDMSRGPKIDNYANLSIYLKGAPDKVFTRCSKVLINGQDVEFDEEAKNETISANDLFAKQGERVLAFARCDLDPAEYPKEYQFDITGWKTWGEKNIPKQSKYPGWFPLWDLTLIGLVSLNDPPRPRVDISVQKCQMAGIKVIMVTGDQPPTAAAIAHKINIITNPDMEYNNLRRAHPELDEHEAFAMAKAIVIHGDELDKVFKSEELLDDMEIEKGRKIKEWIRKDEVVFARTTPAQKLMIVDACQGLGHVVAVTGDGVNDSPAIKKADIGIAMGSGSDVAKNAADMLLLDDNFCSIVNGVEEGRLIFDNLKKSIAYTLSSNIPEISPFLCFMIFQVPLPLSTVLILCIDLGTDMVPAISFAYENPELDIMERFPRNSKRDHLVNSKLISFAYLQIGIVQASAGFFTYFYILNDYGLRPETTFKLALEPGFIPATNDEYSPDQPGVGNSNWNSEMNGATELDWNGVKHAAVDFRLFYVNRPAEAWSRCRWLDASEGLEFYRLSGVSGTQICWTTEALRYAQGGYLISIVCVQWSDLMICKTRNLSISQQGMINNHSNFGLFFETTLVAILSYVPFLNIVLGTRPIAFPHFAVPSFSFFAIIMGYDELRKIFVRNGFSRNPVTRRIKYTGWVARNTYY